MRTLLCTMLFAAATVLNADTITLAENGNAKYVIVLPGDTTRTINNAATELASHLKAITGADFRIVDESHRRGWPAIFIGHVNAAKDVFVDPTFASAKPDTTAISFKDGNIYLSGKPQSGPLYAVYTFLEDYCGVRWWSYREATIPHRPTLTVEVKNYLYSPVLISRGAFYRDACGIQAVRNKANDQYSYIPKDYGTRMLIIGKVHTFNQFMPPSKYFDAHPDWFPMINGSRCKGNQYQLCLTNEEMTKEFTAICLNQIAANPDAPIISVSQNDSDSFVTCDCSKCSAVIAEDGESGLLLQFVNKVAAGIKEKYPNILVETLAYHQTLEPPKKTRPAENVVIRFCPISADYAQPLESGANNKKVRECLERWSKEAPRLFIWNYVANFRNYLYPHPNYRNLAKDIRFFIQNNAIGIFEQGDAGCTIGDLVRPRAWVLQKLLWNPNLDDHKLWEEFFNGYYGAAGPELLKYMNFLCDTVETAKVRLPCDYTSPDFWLKYEDILQARKIYENAEKLVADQPIFAERVRRDRLSLDYAYLNSVANKVRSDRLKGMKNNIDRDAVMKMADEFIRETDKWKVLQFREHVTFAGHAQALKDKLTAVFDVPVEKLLKICPSIKSADWDWLSPAFFVHTRIGNWCFYVDDPASLCGKAVRMPNTHQLWAFQGMLPAEYKMQHKKWKFVVEVRCDAKNNTGKALSFGIYDTKNKKSLFMRVVNASECSGGSYAFIETPAVELGDEQMFWCAPELRSPEEKSNIYISSVLAYAAEK